MPRKKNEKLTARSFLIVNENTVLPFETLTQEQRNKYIPKIMKNISGAVSDYINCNPEKERSYIEDKLAKAVAELDRHLNGAEVQSE